MGALGDKTVLDISRIARNRQVGDRQAIDRMVNKYRGVLNNGDASDIRKVQDELGSVEQDVRVKAMRLVVDRGVGAAKMADNLHVVPTLYALQNCVLGGATRSRMVGRFAADAAKMKLVAGLVNPVDVFEVGLPYPMPNGRFVRLEEMTDEQRSGLVVNVATDYRMVAKKSKMVSQREEGLEAHVERLGYESVNGGPVEPVLYIVVAKTRKLVAVVTAQEAYDHLLAGNYSFSK